MADELISRQAAKEAVKYIPWCDWKAFGDCLDELHAADAVEVVRCKDCIRCGFCGEATNLEVMGFDGYCSRGKRREKMRLTMDNARAAEVLCMATTYNGCGRATSDELKEAISIAYNALRNSSLRPKAEWDRSGYCSICAFWTCYCGDYNFCPNCGADMRGAT